MNTIQCAQCGGQMQVEEGRTPRLCPYCGKPLRAQPEQCAPSELEERLRKARNPQKKYQLIQEALAAKPDDFEANEALLYHGRLHEPLGRARDKAIDFSNIKCHLFSAFDTPERYTPDEIRAKCDELVRGEQLLRTMALAPDAQAFFEGYIRRLAYEYITLFLQGDSRNSHAFFGISRPQNTVAKRCGERISIMLSNIKTCGAIDDAQRVSLLCAVREGYEKAFPGYTVE